MRKIVQYDDVKENKDFWRYFFCVNFPCAEDKDSDMSLLEIIEEKYEISKKWQDEFTGFYEGVFDENDGYVNDSSTLKIELKKGIYLFIEFHPGDTLYFLNDKKIGCTGPDFFIRKISWTDFECYTRELGCVKKILLLPMVYVYENEKEKLKKCIFNGLKNLYFEEEDFELFYKFILENCLINNEIF